MPRVESEHELIPLIERAIAAHGQGATETAERLSIEVLERAPDRIGALGVLYEIRKHQGKSIAAEALVRRIVAIDPNNFPATNE